MSAISSWLGSKLGSFAGGSYQAVKDIWFFILNLNNYITQFFVELGKMIGYLIRAVATGNSFISTMPVFLQTFALATLTVLVAYKILGRR